MYLRRFVCVGHVDLFHAIFTFPKLMFQSLCRYSTINALQRVAFSRGNRIHINALTMATTTTQ